MTRIGSGAGDQHMVNDFVIHPNRLREGNKKSTKTSLLLAPAMRDGEAINDQVFTFTFAGDDPLRFIDSNMLLRHELHTHLASDFCQLSPRTFE